ncbi:SOS response-associated peptidase [Paenibacillus xerothermodurans]|uniref:Abasic site processing protein n=1 Tax=Paenibacillus xerothermodurans TaxID=1977292 RepID=A0A2W1NUD0_PAEXE|nr:SOS response-associated peptidase [Paenibacillus xerothermodurans]PZE22263.1 SOS response-associated peptidase [Paenibacillus xerothermodurans]
MCESISILADAAELTEKFGLDNILFYVSNRYDIRPTQSIPAIVVRERQRQLDEFRWGLMPFWARNAVCMDSDSIPDQRIYRRMFGKQRCVIPCSAFYVSKTVGRHSQWVRIAMRAGTFGIAGLYDVWSSPSGEELRTCTMLMTASNPEVAAHHDRMPAILEDGEVEQWLQPELRDPVALHKLLRPADGSRMSFQLLDSHKDKFAPQHDPEPAYS